MSVSMVKEQERIQALRRYQILDTPPDGAFDRVTEIGVKMLTTIEACRLPGRLFSSKLLIFCAYCLTTFLRETF